MPFFSNLLFCLSNNPLSTKLLVQMSIRLISLNNFFFARSISSAGGFFSSAGGFDPPGGVEGAGDEEGDFDS
jgi:hypothetical protein